MKLYFYNLDTYGSRLADKSEKQLSDEAERAREMLKKLL